MKKIIEENYKSIVKRGLINSGTTKRDFIDKLNEEVGEFMHDYITKDKINSEELADIILVSLNLAKHFNINIEQELINKIEINKNR